MADAATGIVFLLPSSQVLYVMELVQNQEEGKAYFSSISEFLLTHPVLSFGIQVVSRCRLRHTEVLPAEEESDGLAAGKPAEGALEKKEQEEKSFL